MPEEYEWGLWLGGERWIPHSYVYHRDVSLQAGKTCHFLTRNLLPVTSASPDPVMYVVRGNDIVAFNDDYTGLASEIIYTPTVTDTYRVVIRAYATSTPGFCDVYQGEGGRRLRCSTRRDVRRNVCPGALEAGRVVRNRG